VKKRNLKMKRLLRRRKLLLPMRLRKVLVMKPLFAKTVEMTSSLPLVRKHFILRRDLITLLFAARVARMPRKDVWMVEEEVDVVVEEEVIVVEAEEEFATPTKEVNATEEVIADSLMRVEEEEVGEVVAEEDVEVEEEVIVVQEEAEEFATRFKRENATVVLRAVTLINTLK
jgi:hypothetical protein